MTGTRGGVGAPPPGSTVSDAQTAQALLDSKLVLLTGKGGTGKTTFSAALSVLGALRGRRVLLVEMDSQRPALTPIFNQESSFEPIQVRPRLDVANLLWAEALEAFLTNLVPSRRIVRLILSNRMVSRFLDFTPGSQEIVILSALGQLVDRYDLVVADLPASGHAFSLLDITRSAMGLFRSGPVRGRAEELRAMITAPTTRVALMALPEEMVVNETIETYSRLQKFELLSQPPTVFLNRATMPTFTDDERELLQRLGRAPLNALQAEFVRAGRWEAELEEGTALSQQTLLENIPGAPILVPPAPPGGNSRDSVGHVAAHLGRLVGIPRRELEWD